VAEPFDEAIVRSLRFARRGPFAGSVVRILEGLNTTELLVTRNIFCDGPLHPRDLVWYLPIDLRPLNEMEVIGAMSL